ncbi:aromatic ring-hydroxylating dioxygenase subunit alpha [Halieaceae bacterium IMCC14734]|uniref:Aromatic ring-hydroxylating dioxygenase subunit alpha n=1 Tax=Candidatus Litorirhabdus singularis TaxID=2518993 RepID=A0ABT3TD05_9GAMM|nr:aromatic ring-hydroxylating dioxygenase subunit alpha [Candidatus Litorirhabdus singularis]MCX2980181.1 aromatic ring-hydroxylating dioxygenase subunit alpha [Candidatus Litorirhabdus singularis]
MNSETKRRTLEDWPQQQLRGHKLEGSRYNSKEFFAQEWEHMWTKVWLLLGREEEMPNRGDWQREDVGPESFIMVRQEDASIRAYYNVCQHRGARLVNEPKGHVNRFVCPYHAWAWTIEGDLNFAQDSEDFPENPCGKLTLEEVRCESFAGFVWINMDPDCVPLKEFLGPVWEDWEGYGIEKWKRYFARTTTVPFNWKVIMDNFNESYHVPTVHRATGTAAEKARFLPGIDTDYKNTRFDLSDEGHNRMIMRGGHGGAGLESDGSIGEPLATDMRDWDLNPDEFTKRGEETREAIQEAKRRIGPERGYDHYANMADEQLTDALHYTLFPNFAVSVWSDGFHFLRARPHPSDPEQCIFDNWWYASQPEGETAPVRTNANVVERDAVVEHEVYEKGELDMGVTIEQDLAIMPGQQAGFASRAYKGAYLAGQESRLSRYHELIDDYIEGRRPLPKK